MQPFFSPSRPPSRTTDRMAVLVLMGMFISLALLHIQTGVLRAESVGLSLMVVGADDSSSSSSISSSVQIVSGGGGGRRHSIYQSQSRIVRLLQEWARRRDGTLHAAPEPMPFKDVPDDAWYAPAVRDFVARGWLDTSSGYFRPADGATRAEVAKLLVESAEDVRQESSDLQSFSDVPSHAWFHPFIEQAASRGWMLGYHDCYGSMPCYTRPMAVVTRAEAIALIVRALNMHESEIVTHTFADVPVQAWYYTIMSTAADRCMIQADGKNMVRPDDILNRAELVVMLERALSYKTEASGCGSTLESAQRATEILLLLWRIL